MACDYVRRLAESDEPVEFVCFASQHDNLVIPRDGQILACAEAVWFERIGHLAMTDNDEVLSKLIESSRTIASLAFAPCLRRSARRSTARPAGRTGFAGRQHAGAVDVRRYAQSAAD